MRRICLVLATVLGTCRAAVAVEPLFSEGFEAMGAAGALAEGWSHFTSLRTVTLSAEFAHGGTYSLKITDEDAKQAVGLRTPQIAVEPDHQYVATAWYHGERGNNMAFYMEYWDQNGKRIAANSFSAMGRDKWVRVLARTIAPPGAVSLTIHFNSHSANRATGWFDDLDVRSTSFVSTLNRRPRPPAAVIHPCGLYREADIARAKENIRRHDWAKKLLEGMQRRARFWLDMPEEKLPYWIPDLTPFRVVDCPKCGAGWRFAWGGNHEKLVCRKCGFTWPHPDYPESESETFPTVVGGTQTIPYYKGEASTEYGSGKRTTYRLSGHLRYRRTGKLSLVGDLGKVYALTGARACAEQTRRVLLRLAEVYPAYLPHDWNRIYPDYRNLQSGKLCGWKLSDASIFIQLATAYDLTYDSGVYSDEDKVCIEERCFREFARLMVATSPRGCCVNDGPTAMGGGALAGLMLGNHETVAWAIEPPDGFLGFIEEYFVRDGHWYEASPSYEGMSVNPLYLAPEALQGYSDPPSYQETDRYDNLDLLSHPLMSKIMVSAVPEVMPDGCLPPTNDSTWHARYAARRAAVQAHWYPSEKSFSLLAWAYGGELDQRGDEYALFRRDPGLVDKVKKTADPSRYSVVRPGVGWGILRTGSTKKDAAVFLDYGPKGSGHGHPDRLNIIYYDYGRELVTDMGYLGWGHPNHPWIRSTASHNQMIVDGKPHGAAGGELEAFSGRGTVQGMIASAPRTYPGVTSTFRRHLVFVDHGPGYRYLVDLFEVEGGEDHQYAFHGDGEDFTGPDLDFSPVDVKTLGDVATGYEFMKELKQASVAESFQCEWISDIESGLGVRLHMLGAPGTTLVCAEANGLRNRSTPFDKVTMHPILVRRSGPSNRFFALVEAFSGKQKEPLQVRRLAAQSPNGWADALEVRRGDRRDIVICASEEAAAGGITLPDLPQLRCHSRLAFVGLAGGKPEHLWALGGTGVGFGKANLEIEPPVSGTVVDADDETDLVSVDVSPGPAWRGPDRYLFINDVPDGAYRVSGAPERDQVARLRLADAPLLDLASGQAFRIVPGGSWRKVYPNAARIYGSVQSLSVPVSTDGGQVCIEETEGRERRAVSNALRDGAVQLGSSALHVSGDTTILVGSPNLLADYAAPTVSAADDGTGQALSLPDAGYRQDMQKIRLEVRETGPLAMEQIHIRLSGRSVGDVQVSSNLERTTKDTWQLTVSLPDDLPADRFTLTYAITDQALNKCEGILRFNTVGVVIPFVDLNVAGSSGAVTKYLKELDTQFYRAVKLGDWVAFELSVDQKGTYDTQLVFTVYDAYGIVQLSLDDRKIGSPVDLYGKELRPGGGIAPVGTMDLAAGPHVLRLEVVDKNPASANYFIGLRELRLHPR